MWLEAWNNRVGAWGGSLRAWGAGAWMGARVVGEGLDPWGMRRMDRTDVQTFVWTDRRTEIPLFCRTLPPLSPKKKGAARKKRQQVGESKAENFSKMK